MRILFPYPREFGYYPDIFEYVTLLRERGIESIYIGAARDDDSSDPGSYIKHLQNENAGRREFAAFVGREIVTMKPDIVHVFHFRSCGILPIVSRKVSSRWIVDVRTIHVETSDRRVRSDFWLRDRLTWIETQTYDRVLALTKTIQNKMSPSLRPIHTVPLGASEQKLNPPDRNRIRIETRSKLNIPLEAPVLLYAGSLSPTRHMDKVLEAFAKVLDRHPEARFVVVGGEIGSDLKSDTSIMTLANLAETIKLSSNIIFTGRLHYSEMPKYYVAADVGISYTPKGTPYQYQPATKLIEYMMAGLIAISNNVPAVLPLVDADENGYLFGETVEEIAEGMCRALALLSPENRESKQTLINKAKRKVRDRDWNFIVDQHLIPIYEELVGS